MSGFANAVHLSKNLYNIAMFYVRNAYTGSSKPVEERFFHETEVIQNLNAVVDQLNIIRNKHHSTLFTELDDQHRFVSLYHLEGYFKLSDQVDYRALPAQANQNVLTLLYRDWKSFFEASSDYKVHPEKYKEKPRIPRYADKDGKKPLVFTNQICKLHKDKKGCYIKFPKSLIELGCPTNKYHLGKFDKSNEKLKEVRLIPKSDFIQLEIVCEKEIEESDIHVEEATRVAGIDIGVDNLMAVAFNTGHHPVLVKGKHIKSVNQLYNKQMAHLQSILRKGKKDGEGRHRTKRMNRISDKRNRRIKDAMHKASKKIVDLCREEEIEVIVVGNTKGWKQEVNLGKKNNQNFVQIPFSTLIQMIKYKAEEAGIKVVVTEESYTSRASAIDEDKIPAYGESDESCHFSGKRIKRGLYQSNEGILINADINGASNIIRKVYECIPRCEDWASGTVDVPVLCI